MSYAQLLLFFKNVKALSRRGKVQSLYAVIKGVIVLV